MTTICANAECRCTFTHGPWVIEKGQRLPGGRIADKDHRYCSDSCAQDDMTVAAANA